MWDQQKYKLAHVIYYVINVLFLGTGFVFAVLQLKGDNKSSSLVSLLSLTMILVLIAIMVIPMLAMIRVRLKWSTIGKKLLWVILFIPALMAILWLNTNAKTLLMSDVVLLIAFEIARPYFGLPRRGKVKS